mmetsp:Transcript_27949/g.82164  ORF Transcript_27949/g.82164 Transcript_27949/m.82164 type:complete len:204 (+) Transcript_27949:2614-3225(+)
MLLPGSHAPPAATNRYRAGPPSSLPRCQPWWLRRSKPQGASAGERAYRAVVFPSDWAAESHAGQVTRHGAQAHTLSLSVVELSAAFFFTSPHAQSLSSSPFLKTGMRMSSFGSPWPSVKVVILPVRSLTSMSRPFLESLPESVMGSLYTWRFSPLTVISQHLKAHFCVSRFTFCRSAPPDPNARLSAAHPFLAMFSRMVPKDS